MLAEMVLSRWNLAEVRRIFFRNLCCDVHIGVHAFEQRAPQRLLLNLELVIAPEKWGDGDDIGTVFDYDQVRAQVTAFARSRHFNLQETLCAGIADICLAHRDVLALRVATEKPDVYPDVEGVGYEIVRMRARG